MNIVLLLVIGVPGVLLLLLVGLFLYKQYLRYSTRIKTQNGISSLEEVTLGGLRQWIFIRGMDQNNPVLIFLHGGPGEPSVGMSSSRRLDAELIKHFTVVHWDQRGGGKSFHSNIPVDSMTLDRLVEDCNELIDHLRIRFDIPKVFIVAHSSGTLIGIRTAHRYPGKIHAYVGVAQIINDHEHERISYDFAIEEAERLGNVRHQLAIKAIGPPPYDTPKKLWDKANYIVRYGGMMLDPSFRKMIGLILPYLTSPEYSLLEGIRTILGRGRNFTTYALWNEITKINFTREIDSIEVPIYFMEGKYDMITPMVVVQDFYNGLNAEKGKRLIIFEDSGHYPMLDEKQHYEDVLVNTILKECRVD
ncbi:MAG: alpha/beta hydrolase [Candidatus Thorarchaeota archaeon]|nr:MAG: alpha/beta hydrolase [Candidatus Thorarchaeota archaeon]